MEIEIKRMPDQCLTLSFNGELIHQTSQMIQLCKSDERELALAVYAVDGGGFVPVVELTSECTETPDIVTAERVDRLNDVENFLYLNEPGELVIDESLPRAERNRMSQALERTYLRAMTSLLDALQQYLQSHPDCEISIMPPQKKSSLLWKLMGRS